MINETKKFDNYLIRHYEYDKERLVVVFTSAGQQGAGESIEEFRGTLSKFNVSCIFITDKENSWLNHDDAIEMMNYISDICNNYKYVFVTGESMGGSSAIAFAAYYKVATRVLSFTPQYSIYPPFILFDSRYRDIGLSIKKFNLNTFLDWGLPENCQIIYGNTEWRDAIHASCYFSRNTNISFANGGGHSVAFFLKILPGNILHKIFSNFTNPNIEFNKKSIADILGSFYTNDIDFNGCSLTDRYKWDSSTKYEFSKYFISTDHHHDTKLISMGGKTRQSSVSAWSKGNIEEDSQRAISLSPGNGFAFHTQHEHMPWWEIDLIDSYIIDEIQIYNRIDSFDIAQRASHLRIIVRDESGSHLVVYNKYDGIVFGSCNTEPLIWRPNNMIKTSIVRIQLLSINALHFEAVRIFGRKVE